jgi:hypothetical protein
MKIGKEILSNIEEFRKVQQLINETGEYIYTKDGIEKMSKEEKFEALLYVLKILKENGEIRFI